VSLGRVAERAARELEGAPAEDVLAWAASTFGPRFAVASSMQDAVLPHLASRAAPGVDVLFVDTGYHFAETIGTRDAVAATLHVRVLTLTPTRTVAEQDADHGPRLHERDPDLCCALRKVAPLDAALASYDAWATGIRRVESPTRAATPLVSYDRGRGKVRVAPLAAWTDDDVRAYVLAHGVLVNPLLEDGYPSVGCAPCTRRPAPGADPRSGRWAGLAKTECGINLEARTR
jgi:phosphoadenosine phosphosulfate reductase